MVPISLQATQSSLVFGPINTAGQPNLLSRTAAILHRRRPQRGSPRPRPDCSICSLTCQWQGPARPRMQPALKRKSSLRAVTAKGWDQTTSRCVEFSTIAFIFLLLPQVVKNYLSASSGNSEALAVLSWVVSKAGTPLFTTATQHTLLTSRCNVGLPDLPLWKCPFAGVFC